MPKEPVELTPEIIKSIRERLCRTQAGMARIVGVTSSCIVRWEVGETRPKKESRDKLRRLWAFVEHLED